MNQFNRFYRKAAEDFAYPTTAAEAVAILTEGNQRFVEVREQLSQLEPGGDIRTCQASFITESVAPSGQVENQAPFAAIFGCSDARVPSEIIFDTGPNRLFVVRVAGNVPGDECLGSIEYAIKSFPGTMKLITVVGHTGCGAVNAAVSTYLNPKAHADIAFSRSLRSVVNHILVAVRSAALSLEQVYGNDITYHANYAKALETVAVYMNTAIVALQLKQELKADGPAVVFGVYNLATSKVGFPHDHIENDVSLTPAPTDPQELVGLGLQLADTESIRQLLVS
ncbi:carbonic anhydrase [Zavarzinella formosa]|uniref:carbonic anhydrase n=1 Tax=Zavarzinella formosa TaxID=360055 RepID=UPI000306C92F|nr:carbonic anhydrase [Zavarzinella formosa]